MTTTDGHAYGCHAYGLQVAQISRRYLKKGVLHITLYNLQMTFYHRL
jgi:hypothetical protein